MPPRERTRRFAAATALVAALFVAAAALRGYVPGAEAPAPEPAADDPVALVVVAVLLIAAVGVVTIAVITRLRHRVAVRPTVSGRPDWLRGDAGRSSWRIALLAFGLILGWLLLTMLLSGLMGGEPTGMDAPGGASSPATSAPPPDRSAVPPPTTDHGSSTDLLSYLYGATVAFVVVIVTGSIVAARTQRGPAAIVTGDSGAAAPPGVGTQTLARAAELGLAEVGDLSREPRRAIIACYAAMEHQLSLVPDAAPREFDTASEVLERAVDHHALAPDSATRLVDLFDEARFSPHVMDEGHRDAAVAVLTTVLEELRSRS